MEFIKKINQSVIEKYPILWNLRFVWMLAFILFQHLLAFFIGFFLTNTADLQDSDFVFGIYAGGFFQLQIMLSVLALVYWAYLYLRNSRLRSLYPASVGSIIKECLLGTLIIFGLLSFVSSYRIGVARNIQSSYNARQLAVDAHTVNKALAFIPIDDYDYDFSNRSYPSPYDSITTNGDDNLVKLFSFPISASDLSTDGGLYLSEAAIYRYQESKGMGNNYRVKRNPLRVDYKLEFPAGSFNVDTRKRFENYNKIFFSGFYDDNQDLLDEFDIPHNNPEQDYYYELPKQLQSNKWVVQFLERNSEQEFNALMKDYLEVLDKYEIETNLTLPIIKEVFQDNRYEVSHRLYDYEVTASAQVSVSDSYKDNALDSGQYNLWRFFENCQSISLKKEAKTWIYYLMFAFAMAVFLLIIRAYGFMPMLYTYLAGLVCSIGLGLFVFVIDAFYIDVEAEVYIVLLLALQVAAWLAIPNKMIRAVVQLLAIQTVPFLVLGVFEKLHDYYPDFTFVDFKLDFSVYLAFALVLVYIMVFVINIRRWRAMPEVK